MKRGKTREARGEKKNMKKRITLCLLATLFLANVSFADAQQTGKVPRIGYWIQALLLVPRSSWRGSDKGILKGSGAFPARFGRPHDFIVDSSPSCFATIITQPNGQPR